MYAGMICLGKGFGCLWDSVKELKFVKYVLLSQKVYMYTPTPNSEAKGKRLMY